MLSILSKVGLSPGESKVYEALLRKGQSSLNSIHEIVGMERRTIYDIIAKLIEKGVVTFVKENKRKMYSPVHPKRLLDLIEEKKSHLDSVQEELRKQISTLQELYGANREGTSAETFRGKEGIKTVWLDMLNYKEIRWLGSGNYIPKKLPLFWTHWNKKRLQKKIKSYHLFRSEIRKGMILDVGEARFLPEEFSGNPIVIAIFGNKVVNFIFGEELFAFVIENKELAQNYRQYHRYLWENVARPKNQN